MRAVLVLLVCATASFGLVRAYSVEPSRADFSGWTDTIRPYNYVGQTICCNFDAPIYAEFFTGTATNASYQVQLLIPGRTPPMVVAHGDTVELRDHVWVRCTLEVDRPDSIIKGRTYEVRWTLSGGSDSLCYYYQDNDPYKYGDIVIPGEGNQSTA